MHLFKSNKKEPRRANCSPMLPMKIQRAIFWRMRLIVHPIISFTIQGSISLPLKVPPHAKPPSSVPLNLEEFDPATVPPQEI